MTYLKSQNRLAIALDLNKIIFYNYLNYIEEY